MVGTVGILGLTALEAVPGSGAVGRTLAMLALYGVGGLRIWITSGYYRDCSRTLSAGGYQELEVVPYTETASDDPDWPVQGKVLLFFMRNGTSRKLMLKPFQFKVRKGTYLQDRVLL